MLVTFRHILLLAVIGLITASTASCTRHAAAPQPADEAASDTVAPCDTINYREYPGQISARQSVEVHARVEGFLDRVLVDEGEYVQKGQTMFVIDPTLYRAAVEKAVANLNRAMAAEEKAKRDVERVRPLFEQNAASHLELDNAEAAYQYAKAEVGMAQAELTQARITLGYTVVKSPITGYVTECHADVGSHVGPGGISQLATMVDNDSVRVDFTMPAVEYHNARGRLANLCSSDSVSTAVAYITLKLPDGADYPFRGDVDFKDYKVDPTTGVFNVRTMIPNPVHALSPGESVQVALYIEEVK